MDFFKNVRSMLEVIFDAYQLIVKRLSFIAQFQTLNIAYRIAVIINVIIIFFYQIMWTLNTRPVGL